MSSISPNRFPNRFFPNRFHPNRQQNLPQPMFREGDWGLIGRVRRSRVGTCRSSSGRISGRLGGDGGKERTPMPSVHALPPVAVCVETSFENQIARRGPSPLNRQGRRRREAVRRRAMQAGSCLPGNAPCGRRQMVREARTTRPCRESCTSVCRSVWAGADR